MGVLQSTVHFENLNGVIDNQSPFEIKYKVTGPISNKDKQLLDLNQSQAEQKMINETQTFSYAGLVSPYSVKYYEFKDIDNIDRFSVFAIKLNQNEVQQIVPLEKDLKIQSQKSICIRIMPQLKVIHLNQKEINLLQRQKKVQAVFINRSKIVKKLQISHRLIKLFPKCPSQVQLLFRASENQFEMKRFYENYGHVESVLLICKTNQNKVIGAYTKKSLIPLQEQTHFDEKGWTSIHDPSNSSFLFSLTSNDIFKLKQGQVALFYNKDQEQICFGSDQLRINNHSDKTINLTQNLNTNYENHNYNNDSESYKIFNGNQSAEFTTKEWQVWKIQFQEQKIEQQDEVMVFDV